MKYRSLAALILVAAAAYGSADQFEADDNADGVTDRWTTIENGVTREIGIDTDYDGKVDFIQRFDEDGVKEAEEQDFNHDGKMDDFYYFRREVLVHREIDSNYDGAIDIWVDVVDGAYIGRMERDTDYDGEVDYVKDYGENSD